MAQAPIYPITAQSLGKNGVFSFSPFLWKYHPGDNPAWANPSYDDANWSPAYSNLSPNVGPNIYWTGIGWFRINIRTDSSLINIPLNFRIEQYGASEVYLNGILIDKLGSVSHDPARQQDYVTTAPLPESQQLTIALKPDTINVIAIRYSVRSLKHLHKIGINGGFELQLMNVKKAVARTIDSYRHYNAYMMLLIGIALAIFLLHLMLFVFYPDKTSNLYYALLIGLYAFIIIIQLWVNATHNLDEFIFLIRLGLIVQVLIALLILQAGYNLMSTKIPKWTIFPLFIGLALIALSWVFVLNVRILVQMFLLVVIVFVSWRILVIFFKQNKNDAFIIGSGLLLTLILVGIQMMANLDWIPQILGTQHGLLASFSFLGIILSMSVYLAKDFATTNRNLKNKLDEVKKLSQLTLEQKEREVELRLSNEREKNKAYQADLRAETAELQLKIKQSEHERQQQELDEARRLQLSMLPESTPQFKNLDLSFYMQTASEVGGDYYDYAVSENGTLTLAIGDATGHCLNAGTLVTATKSLFQLLADQKEIPQIFHNMNQSIRQMNLGTLFMGMTIAKLKKVKDNQIELKISAAGMPPALLYHSETQKIEQLIIKGMPLGTKVDFPYQQKMMKLITGDILLLHSDGITEAFNNGKEIFGTERLISTLKSLVDLDSGQIIDGVIEEVDNWIAGTQAHDDITFILVKIK